MNRGYIFAIFGPEGSGKTTHINLLYDFLKKRGVKVRITWISFHHSFAWALRRLFVRMGYYVWRPSEQCPLVKDPHPDVIKVRRLNGRIWLVIECIGVLLTILFKVKLPSALGYYVIVERYLASALADFTYMFGPSLTRSVAKLLIALANDPHAFYICVDSDYEALCKRRGIRTEPRDYIEAQRQIYGWFSRNFNCLLVNTAKSDINSTQATIRRHVEKGLGLV